MTTHSLSTRLLASVSILLIIFFGITIVLLDLLFRDLSDRAMHERLELQVRTLISASEEEPGGALTPALDRIEPRFSSPGSGLYAEIVHSDGNSAWRSGSLTGTGLDFSVQLNAGATKFTEVHSPDGAAALALSTGIEWEFNNKKTRLFVFSVAENLEP
jgi:two-component system sensor histidine kinase PhoQ